VATLWIAITVVLPDFFDNPITGLRGVITISLYVVALSIVSWLWLYIASLNKYVAAVFVPLYGMIGATVSYYRVMYRVTITPLMLDCILHTNMEEALGVISWSLIVWVGANLLIGIALVIWRWRLKKPKYEWLHALVVLVIFVGYYHINGRLHQSINQRYPMHIVESMRQYVHLQQLRQQPHLMPKYVVNSSPDSLDVVVVIGESARTDHFALNGYNRPTNPLLSQRTNIVSLPHIYSEYTHTLASVPVLLTRADSLHPEYQYSETSFAAILRNEGYHTAWISNQDLGDTFASFPAECDTVVWLNAGKSVFIFSEWYDENLLPEMGKQLAKENNKNLLILHTIGSHWYYNNHVPDMYNYFQPTTDNRVVTNNRHEAVINSYDNTIRYTDLVLDSIIARMTNRCAIVFYISDHGESLGENGNWLHAAGAEETKYPACMIWYSDVFAQQYPEKITALYANKNNRYRTDFLFHSVLSAAGISVVDIDSNMNIFETYHH
jgi:glucan phosphoethanolaminetransferase (alkaline phosphatase superfamily)